MRAELLIQANIQGVHPAIIERQTDREIDELKGPVESVTMQSFRLIPKDFKWKKRRRIKSHFSRYNRDGNKVESCFYHPSGSRSSQSKYQYDVNGKLVKAFEDDFDIMYIKYNYVYDETGKLVRSTECDADGKISFQSEYHYDSNSFISESIQYRENGLICNWIQFFYDGEGNKIESTQYSELGAMEKKEVYWYNRKGQLTQKVWSISEIQENHKENFSYDFQGNLVESIEQDSEEKTKRVYYYDDDSRMVGEEFYQDDGSLSYKSKFSYKWDKYGNWWKRKIIHHYPLDNDWHYLINYRKITYF